MLSDQIRSAYAALHARHIIHNDVEPRHILLAKTGVKIIDFDRAKSMDDVGVRVVVGEGGGGREVEREREEVEREREEVERLIRRCGRG